MGRVVRHTRRDAPVSAQIDLELVVNELAAEQAATRIVVQSLLLRLFAVRPQAAEAALGELRDHVLKSIDAIPVAPDDQAGGTRWKGIVRTRASDLLGEIADTLGSPAGKRRPTN
jgi:hypothetical protein